MNISLAEKRQIENEMIFRQVNEKVGTRLHDVDVKHIKEGNSDLVTDNDMILYFNCECSDENCSERIPVSLRTYKKIHLDRSNFIIKLQHEVDAIEKVIRSTLNYSVVHKNNIISSPAGLLNTTTINNAKPKM